LARSMGMEIVKGQRDYNKALYKLRHLAENAFLALKRMTQYLRTKKASKRSKNLRTPYEWEIPIYF